MTENDTNKIQSLSGRDGSEQDTGSAGNKRRSVSNEDVPFREKPDSGDTEKRIDAHSLFSMFTANMIKEKIKWFR